MSRAIQRAAFWGPGHGYRYTPIEIARPVARPLDWVLGQLDPTVGGSRRFDVAQDINVLALVKGDERYVFLYNDSSRAATLRVLGRFASNPELSFSWYDAAVLSQRIRQESQPAPQHAAPFLDAVADR